MKKSIHHFSRHGRFLLVLMLAFASFVPGALHAGVMAGSGPGNGHHMTGISIGISIGHAPGDQSMISHNHADDVQKASTELPLPMGSDQNTNPCCPMVCSVALCLFEPEWSTQFIPDSFEAESMLGFVVPDMALPERPPRA